MTPQGKTLTEVPTCFDLALGLSKAMKEAESLFEEEDFMEHVQWRGEGAHTGGEPDQTRNAAGEVGRMGAPSCSAGESETPFQLAQNTLMIEGRSSAAGKNKKVARKRRRNKKRKLDAQEQGRDNRGLKLVALKRRRDLADGGTLTSTNMQGEDLKVAKGGWLGSLKNTFNQEESHLEGLLNRGFELIKWDGR